VELATVLAILIAAQSQIVARFCFRTPTYRPMDFGKRATHGVINKTYSVTHLNVTEASRAAIHRHK
jgi:hypothetical protein